MKTRKEEIKEDAENLNLNREERKIMMESNQKMKSTLLEMVKKLADK